MEPAARPEPTATGVTNNPKVKPKHFPNSFKDFQVSTRLFI